VKWKEHFSLFIFCFYRTCRIFRKDSFSSLRCCGRCSENWPKL